MINFRQWLCESIWNSSYQYSAPEDPELQLYDFYMLGMLNRLGRTQTPTQQSDKLDLPEDIQYIIAEIEQKLLPKSKKDLLDAVFLSIASEFRHIDTGNSHRKIKQSFYDNLGQQYTELFNSWHKEYMARIGGSDVDFNYDFQKPDTKLKAWGEEEAQESYESALLVSKNNPQAFVVMAEYAFNNLTWEPGYGGKNWGNVCDAWLMLHKAKTFENIFTAIDHIYDVEHNNGTVFDKVVNYSGPNNYTWLKNALDFKRYIKSPYAIIDHVSPSMKKIALRILKHDKGTSYDQWSAKTGNLISIYKSLNRLSQMHLRKKNIHEETLAEILTSINANDMKEFASKLRQILLQHRISKNIVSKLVIDITSKIFEKTKLQRMGLSEKQIEVIISPTINEDRKLMILIKNLATPVEDAIKLLNRTDLSSINIKLFLAQLIFNEMTLPESMRDTHLYHYSYRKLLENARKYYKLSNESGSDVHQIKGYYRFDVPVHTAYYDNRGIMYDLPRKFVEELYSKSLEEITKEIQNYNATVQNYLPFIPRGEARDIAMLIKSLNIPRSKITRKA